jgi:hypothetical protein
MRFDGGSDDVFSQIKGLKDNPLTAFLSEAGKGVAPADLTQPAK